MIKSNSSLLPFLVTLLLCFNTPLRAGNPRLVLVGLSITSASAFTYTTLSGINTNSKTWGASIGTSIPSKIAHLIYLRTVASNNEKKQKVDSLLQKLKYASMATAAGGLGIMAYSLIK